MRNMSLPHVNGYDVTEKIGVGSFSVVYKALTKVTKETVAIKCIDKCYQKKSFAEDVINEITLLKLLKHDYIVRLIDFMWDIKYIFIITEYCDQGDLSTFIRKKHKLSEAFVKTLMQQLALALKFLRSHNICHMDLKPQNLLITSKPNLQLKVADFGLSQIISSHNTSELRYAGSVLYMAPEKLLHQPFDARIDLWSVGVIMFECLFGRSPFFHLTTKQITEFMNKKVPIEIPPNMHVSPSCENLLTSLLKYEVQDRITFEEYFNHEFLDLSHAATSENYLLTIKLLEEAINLDKTKQYSSSLPKYKEAVLYLERFVTVETDYNKKAILNLRLREYTAWITTLTEILSGKNLTNYKVPQPISTNICSNETYESLCDMSQTTPALLTALDIGKTGELYYSEGKKQLALEKLTTSFTLLFPLLDSEPVGVRKDMLRLQIEKWMTLAEFIKEQLS
ncbi:hypothetical protein RI129_012164 [Pyrocoelia pectoralis]|uniref:non-specific serine/threonine protein kinase n=1 Tax=Pyrocoelia pectoralis TaxID=417401 RepID=A0AAN7V1W4_9COLE